MRSLRKTEKDDYKVNTAIRSMQDQLNDARVTLTADKTFYVATTGNDTTGDGSAGHPWASPQVAWNYIQAHVDSAGYAITISVADGTYDPPVGNSNAVLFLDSYNGDNLSVSVVGNITTPANVVFNTGAGDGSGYGIWVSGPHYVFVNGIKFAGGTGKGVFVLHPGAKVYFYQANVEFGALGRACHAYMGEIISYQSDIAISGNMEVMYTAEGTGNCDIENTDHTLTGTPAFSSAFASAFDAGIFLFYNSTFTGAATGSRFSVERNGVINGDQNDTFLPGSTAGTIATGGVYGTYTDYDLAGHTATDGLWTLNTQFVEVFPATENSLKVEYGTGDTSISAGDTLATFRCYGTTSGSVLRMEHVQSVVTAAAEEAKWLFKAHVAGTNTTVATLGNGIIVGTGSALPGNGNLALSTGQAFSGLPASPTKGMIAVVTNSATTTWAATISGGGASSVLAWYNGTNWTVIGA